MGLDRLTRLLAAGVAALWVMAFAMLYHAIA
ncbi:hypothetical protein FB597_101999 [Herbaspirillum sp. SJZ099]|nr:hypothetical protein FB597_101999 [Herbaspirillum sp. SJZ099]